MGKGVKGAEEVERKKSSSEKEKQQEENERDIYGQVQKRQAKEDWDLFFLKTGKG